MCPTAAREGPGAALQPELHPKITQSFPLAPITARVVPGFPVLQEGDCEGKGSSATTSSLPSLAASHSTIPLLEREPKAAPTSKTPQKHLQLVKYTH